MGCGCLNPSLGYKTNSSTGQHEIYMVLDVLCQTESLPRHLLEETSRYTYTGPA
jgi:hypothetical protein